MHQAEAFDSSLGFQPIETIDIHCHVLPEMDDGSRSVEESAILLDQQKQAGIHIVCATPHFYADNESPESFLKRRAAALEKLQPLAEKRDLELHAGAEVKWFLNMSKSNLEDLRISGTNILLVEMPFEKWTETMIDEVLALQESGKYQVVLAHIERYLKWNPLRNPVWERFEEAGIVFQINAGSLLNFDTRSKVLKLLKQERISFIASDTHRADTRPVKFIQAAEILYKKLPEEKVRRVQEKSQEIFGSCPKR